MKCIQRTVLTAAAALSAALIAACSGPLAVDPGEGRATGPPAYGLITPQQAVSLIVEHQEDPDFVLLDVRRDSEILAGHISGAESLDFYDETFAADLDQLDRTKIYLIYCRTGNRTGQTYVMMENLGFERVYDMDGGIAEWTTLGYPTCQGPLDAEHSCSGEFPGQESDA